MVSKNRELEINVERLQRLSDEIAEIIFNHVRVRGYNLSHLEYGNPPSEIWIKIDLLERMLELLRFQNRCPDNRFPLEWFVQGNVEVKNGCVHFAAPQDIKWCGSGTPPIQLQPKLLLFLFYRNLGGDTQVYEIIDTFIKLVWDQLTPLDFKKTLTGVTRCFTNTRFAANILRVYGLLKFTKREAYKTWVLSLTGLLTASALAAKANWKLSSVDKKYPFELHPDIRDVFTELEDFQKFVNILSSICKSGTKAFDEFKQGSQRAFSLLKDYRAVMWNSDIKKEERRKKSVAHLKKMEQDPQIRDFYEEFRRSVKAGDLLLSQ